MVKERTVDYHPSSSGLRGGGNYEKGEKTPKIKVVRVLV